MDTSARVEADGRITIPAEVCEALGLSEGDSVRFISDGERVTISRIPNFIALAGSFEVPEDKRGLPWHVIREETWREVAKERAGTIQREEPS